MAKGAKVSGEPPENGLKRLKEKFAKDPKPLGLPAYLRANFDRFEKLIQSVGRRSDKWEVIVRWAREEKLTGEKEIKPDAARRAYERERAARRVGAPDPKVKPPRRDPKPTKTAPPVRMAEPEERPAPDKRDEMDSLAASLDAGRAWQPRKPRGGQ